MSRKISDRLKVCLESHVYSPVKIWDSKVLLFNLCKFILILAWAIFEYVSCIHALLFLPEIFTASFWSDVLPCVKVVVAETISNLWSVETQP